MNARGLASLQRYVRGSVTTAPDALTAVSRDFGGLVRHTPAAIVRPAAVEDVGLILKIAAEHDVSVSTRGSGHSQSGQCLGGDLVVDLQSIGNVLAVNEREQVVEVEAGARWRTVVDHTFTRRWLPEGLTHVLDTTVGGTLSVAGVGAESWRVGPQVDNVRYLDVVTLDGRIVRCNSTQHQELFNATRAGLGQFGIVVRAGYPIRRCSARVRSRWLLYRSTDRFMADVEAVCSRGSAAFVSGLFVQSPWRQNRWALALVLGFEYEDGTPVEPGLPDLAFDGELPTKDAPLWDKTGVPGHTFFRLYAPSPGSVDADPSTLHPWTEHVFDKPAAQQTLRDHMNGAHSVLSLGTNGLIFIRRREDPAPLFATPTSEGLLWGIGVFASIRPSLAGVLMPLIREYAARGETLGGKRYPSGYLGFSCVTDWSKHFGASWVELCRAKQQFDPKHLLNPGCVMWD